MNTSIEEMYSQKPHPKECDCNNQILKESPSSILERFVQVFGIKICKLRINSSSRKISLEYFGGNLQSEAFYLMEIPFFDDQLEKTYNRLTKLLRTKLEIGSKEQYKKVSKIQLLLERMDLIRLDPTNHMYCILTRRDLDWRFKFPQSGSALLRNKSNYYFFILPLNSL